MTAMLCELMTTYAYQLPRMFRLKHLEATSHQSLNPVARAKGQGTRRTGIAVGDGCHVVMQGSAVDALSNGIH